MMRSSWAMLLLSVACASSAPSQKSGSPASEDVGVARTQNRKRVFEWQPWSHAAFEKARTEKRFILLHGAAEWCHWCHVMEETTYTDPEIGKILADGFVTIRVDVDSRPDFMERYSAWGWPATIILSSDAQELGKYRGFLPADRMKEILQGIERVRSEQEHPVVPEVSPPVAALDWIASRTVLAMDDFYDDELGSWGRRQKLSLGHNVLVELERAQRGDERAKRRAAFTLKQTRAILDPVWGGVYQYSTGGTWNAPHFEKLMTVQAPTLEAYARAANVLGDGSFLDDAKKIHAYLNRFLRSPDGAYFTNQDADVGSHDPNARFVDGHVFFAADEAGRQKLGTPWVDTHVYARENGIVIQALVSLHETTNDPTILNDAQKAAGMMLARHVHNDGSVIRDAGSPTQPLFLVDAAELGIGLLRLHEVDRDAKWLEAARKIAAAIDQKLDAPKGGFYDHTEDPDAAGVFRERACSLGANASAARFVGMLSTSTGDARWKERGEKAIAAVATPKAVTDQGRMLGGFLLALAALGHPGF